MSILIKGMEMPKDCLKCPFCLFVDGYWKCLVDGSHADFGGTCRPQNCPLVQVHTPHGRLIDADELVNKLVQLEFFSMSDYNNFVSLVLKAPTVIQKESAEEEKNDEYGNAG